MQEFFPPQVELCFLGTSSMASSDTRNVSCIGLRISAVWWLFDCGEGSQTQLHQTAINPSTVSRIFITHLHGDHVFGLPGMLLKVGNSIRDKDRVIEIIGPKGLRNFLRQNLLITESSFACKYLVHELWDGSATPPVNLNSHKCEILGRNIPKSSDRWEIPNRETDISNDFRVFAARVKHSCFCVGYVAQEIDYPGRLKVSKIPKDRLLSETNRKYLKQLRGISNPLELLSDLRQGKAIELIDGKIEPDQVIGESRKGRRIVILGDTCDSRQIAGLAVGADVVVHECTNAFIPSMDQNRTTAQEVEARTYIHGHSTPKMVGQFANAIQCRTLLLTHFSRRYKGDTSPESENIMKEIVCQTTEYFGSKEVHCAHDFDIFPLPAREESTAVEDDTDKAIQRASHAADAAARHAKEYFARHPASTVDQEQVAALSESFP